MPPVTRQGDLCTGHDACGPVSLTSGSPNVLVNGKPVGRVGDPYAPHGCENHSTHTPHIAQGSGTVLVNGIPVSRIGDSVDCGGSVMQGSGNVIVG